MTAPTYLFTGGGTGGHLFPGIAVVEELRRRAADARVVFVGSDREIERRIVEAAGIEHRVLPIESSTTLRRNPIRFAWRYWRSTREARRLLDELGPNVVVGLGGFASVPVVREAVAARSPAVLLEQNVVPGRATSWLAKRVSVVCTSFEQTAGRLPARTPVEMTGNPVRSNIAELLERPAATDHPTLLVLGGSQGAIAVNDAVLAAVERLAVRLAGWRIVHQAGERDVARVRAAYAGMAIEATVEPFFEDLMPHYAEATMAIARAGATSLAELACAGVPTIMLPYPGAIHDHQTRNAIVYANAAAGWYVRQESQPAETATAIAAILAGVPGDPAALVSRRAAMQALAWPNAAAAVADVIERVRWR